MRTTPVIPSLGRALINIPFVRTTLKEETNPRLKFNHVWLAQSLLYPIWEVVSVVAEQGPFKLRIHNGSPLPYSGRRESLGRAHE
jgi:hypothetical protein